MGETALGLGTLSAEQYLAEEQARAYKCEYVDGQVYAFAGATDRHNRVIINAQVTCGWQRGGVRVRRIPAT